MRITSVLKRIKHFLPKHFVQHMFLPCWTMVMLFVIILLYQTLILLQIASWIVSGPHHMRQHWMIWVSCHFNFVVKLIIRIASRNTLVGPCPCSRFLQKSFQVFIALSYLCTVVKHPSWNSVSSQFVFSPLLQILVFAAHCISS